MFVGGIVAAVVCLVIALVYWAGVSPLGQHLKHGLLFFGLAVLAALFALANRQTSTVS
jgi:hypothetical protein